MKRSRYETITGRRLDLGDVGAAEAELLAAVLREYEERPEWSRFAAWWSAQAREARLGTSSVVYRICQDLEARLGIAQGKLARPDYRDCLADLIEERFGSRYRFCKETGVDPGHLSRVLSSRSELSLQNLQRILDSLHAALVIRPEEEVTERLTPERALRSLTAAAP
jgi:hypothetical protein